jgi:hypothetical protein
MAVHTLHGCTRKDFCRFVSPTLLQLLRVLTTGFKLRSFLPLIIIINQMCIVP